MSIRSDILIHWTEPRQSLFEAYKSNPVDRYVDHIKSIYSKGLKYSEPEQTDEVHGALGVVSEIPRIPMICYTELRLSEVGKHTQLYGPMGIGFERNWLMRNRWANPVFYVQNDDQGAVNTNLPFIISERHKINGLETFLSFVKPMSKYNKPELNYYDEMEWRMVLWVATIKAEGHVMPLPPPKWISTDGSTSYFRFSPDEVTIIVAPDEDTRKAILCDETMREYFNEHEPMMVTAESCSQF